MCATRAHSRGCAIIFTLVALGFVSQAALGAAPAYRIVALGALPGTIDTIAFGQNDVGAIAGASYRDRSTNVGQARPVVWDQQGVAHELWNDLDVGGVLQDINNAGAIVGRYGSGSGIPLPGPGVPYGRAFYWDAGSGLTDIAFGPYGNSEAAAINDGGLVAGTSQRLEPIDLEGAPVLGLTPRAFVWDSVNGIRDLQEPPGRFAGTFAVDDNNVGEVVGYGILPTGIETAFVWDGVRGLRELPKIAGGSTRALAINNLGQILGFEFGTGAVIWDAHTTEITQVAGGLNLNNVGDIVGGGTVGDPTIWDLVHGSRRLTPLLANGSGWQLDFTFDINDAGDIVGYGELESEVRGFLLVPVPEPSAAHCLGISLLILVQRQRRNRANRFAIDQ